MLRQVVRAIYPYHRLLFIIVVIAIPFIALPHIRSLTRPKPSQFTKALFSNLFTIQHTPVGLTSQLEANKKEVSLSVSRGSSKATFAMAVAAADTAHNSQEVIYTTKEGVDVRYQSLPNGIKEEIILNKPQGRSTFLSTLAVTNATPLITQEGQIIFVGPDGTYQFHIMQPYAVDANGEVTHNIKYRLTDATDTYKKISKDINKHTYISQQLLGPIQAPPGPGLAERSYMLVLDMDPSWLDDPARAYPVIIDPTVVHDTTSEFAAGTMNRVTDTGSGSSPLLESYYQEADADRHTVGLWHMDEGTDNTCSGGEDICDSSHNGIHGTFVNQATFSSTSRIGPYSLYFDGVNDYVTFGDVDILDTPSQFTIALWFNRTTDMGVVSSHAIENVLIAQASLGANDNLEIGSNGSTIDLYVDTAGTDSFSVEAGITNNTWYHLAVVYDSNKGQELTAYLNGRFLSSWNTPSGPLASSATSPLSLGISRAGSDNNGDYNGYIDDVLISLKPYSPEEIMSLASRRPSAAYSSEVLDLGGANSWVTTWNSFSWTELGATTGDGETVYDNTGLVAQWNFNETSGTTADNSAGSCGATCDGTLTGFASTASQDQAINTGWTANNRRWGAGALMFDGTDDNVDAGTTANLKFTGDFSLEAWVRPSGSTVGQIVSSGAASDWLYLLGGSTVNSPVCKIYQANSGSGYLQADGKTPITDGKWHHVVCTLSGTTLSVYIDGILDATSSTTTGTRDVSSAGTFTIGKFTNATSSYYAGSMDAVRAYSRALTASEILSNYSVGQIELQTRVGATTTPDDGSWEAWRPVTNETAIDAMDLPYMYGTGDSGLIAYWPLDETTEDSCTGGEDACDVLSGHDGVNVGGSTIIDGKYGNARSFGTANDGINIYSAGLDTDFDETQGSVSLWMKVPTAAIWADATNDYIFALAADTSNYIRIYRNTTNISLNYSAGGTTKGADITYSGLDWVHLAISWNKPGDSVKTYINGELYNTSASLGTWTGALASTRSNIGSRLSDGTDSFIGHIDEVRLYNTQISDDAMKALYTLGSTKPEHLQLSSSSVIKAEGNQSQQIQTTSTTLDTDTIGLWHLDETGGTGAYIKDNSNSANHGTPTGTSFAQGISGKARDFNGSTDYIDMGDIGAIDSATTLSGCAWVFHDTSAADHHIMGKNNSATDGLQFFRDDVGSVSGRTDVYTIFIADSVDTDNTRVESTTNSALTNKWNQVCFTYLANSATGLRLYINGIEDANSPASTSTIGAIDSTTNPFRIGSTSAGAGFFDGKIDEAIIWNRTLTADEIAESYRLGRDHYLTETIASTDLSAKTTLPFYVAADRPGSYLSASIGESPYVIGQPDTNTVVFWRLDEQSGSGAYIKDSSSTNYHGTPTGTTFTEGKVGKARYFNGTSDYIDMGDPTAVDFGSGDFTLEAWAKRDTVGATQMIISKDSDTTGRQFFLAFISTNVIRVSYNTSGGQVYLDTTATISDTNWHHISGQRSGNSFNIYIDGMLSASGTTGGTHGTMQAVNTNIRLGQRPYTGNLNYFHGSIDEVRISDTARSADEIRQAYEHGMGLRSHQITIDFGADLDSGNLITGSGDLSFTVDATAYGLSVKGSQLFTGDKVIVRENYDGTEYIAQGTVTGITASTGAVTVAGWDTGSTFPSGGYTAGASVFKWQREYWNHRGKVLDSHLNGITNISFRLTDGNESRTIWLDDLRSSGGYLTAPGGSTITSSTGERYFQYRTIFSSSDEAVSPQLSQVTLDYTINTAPNTPTLNAPTDTATNQLLTPALQTTTTDADSDYLRYKIELCTDVGMTANCQTLDQTSSQTGWSGQNAQTNTAYTSGTQATHTLQTPLSAGATYYWRSYAIDPAGTNTWSSTQTTPFAFTTSAAPSSPTLPWTEGSTNPTGVTDTTPEFSAIHNDSDGDPAVYYEIEVNTNNTFTGTVMWDSNQTAMTSTANGARSPDISYAGSALSLGGTYYWRIRFTDDNSITGDWSTTQSFAMNAVPSAPTLDSPTNGATNRILTLGLKTTGTDANGDYLQYKIELCTNAGMTADCQTFDQTSSQTGWSGQNAQTSTAYTSGTQATYTTQTPLSISTTYYWRSYSTDPGGTNTWSPTQGAPYSFTTSDGTANLNLEGVRLEGINLD